jgi:glucosylglycerate synthase
MSDVSTQERPTAPRSDGKVTEESLLSDDFVRQLISVGEIDLLVGLPTHNNAKTVGPVVTAIQDGILRWFPRERAAIINADAGSRDGTAQLVVDASIDDGHRRSFSRQALRTLHSISTQCRNGAGGSAALQTILAAAELLRARACVVVSPESVNIVPDWVPALLRPVYREEFDLVLPTYARNKFDGLLITNLLYPMVRALYGLKIREPYATEFAFSGRLASQFLAQNSWSDEAGTAGGEVRLTLAALAGGFRISQSFLGTKSHLDHQASDLVPALRRTMGVLFSSMESTFPLWNAKNGSQSVPTVGAEQQVILDLLRVNRKRLREMFCSGVAELHSVFQSILSPATLAQLQGITCQGESEFNYSDELWVRTLYEFAASYHHAVISRDHIIQALAPLFRGRAFTFLMENRSSGESEVERHIESLCLEFERLKPYLLQRWSSRE